MTPIAEVIYAQFKNIDSINKSIGQQSEGLYLEFKTKSNSNVADLDKEDKKNFADALSQFANSDGGVLIWGIKTDKPLDVAKELRPIKEVSKFMAKLQSYLKDAVQPIVDGVLFDTVYSDRDSNEGYVRILIPVSYKVPHRSMFSREYFKRNQEGKYKLEHFDLEDMFGRRQKPLLSVEIVPKTKINFKELVKEAKEDGYLPPAVFNIFIHNDGRTIGKNSMVVLSCPDEKLVKCEFRLRNYQIVDISDMYNNHPVKQIPLNNSIFYPNLITRLGEIFITLHKDAVDRKDIYFSWTVYAEDMLEQTGKVPII